MPNNIEFRYLYRDAANYKNFGYVVFSNRNNAQVEALERAAREILIDTEFFVAKTAKIPELWFEKHLPEFDHDWHQFDEFVPTDEAANDPEQREIEAFLRDLRAASVI